MEHHKFQFKAITRLRLFDIKAQKKTIPFKKFCSIPLSYEETLKQNFQSFKTFQFPLGCRGNNNYRRTQSSLNLKRLSQPKSLPADCTFIEKQNKLKTQQLGKIMKKCGTMMRLGANFQKRMSKFQKHSDKCLAEIQRRVDFIISEGTNNLGYR